MATGRRVLLVEVDYDDAAFLRASLATYTDSVDITHKDRISDAVAVLEDEPFDIVLLDLNLPDGRGAECVEKIHAADELVPIVVLSGHDDEDFAVDILSQGVQDYLVKWEGDGRIILRAIRYAIERKRAENKINYLARLDWVTCIPNEQYLGDELQHAITRAFRGRRTLGLMLLDIDQFDEVSEKLGRGAGDDLLRACAQRLSENVREADVLARLRGNRFAVLLEDVDGPLEIELVARNISAALQRPFEVHGRELTISASVGIAIFPHECTDAEALLANAESALIEARAQDSATFRFFSESIQGEVSAHRRLERDLGAAIDRGQFELMYRPQVRLADDRVESVEARLCWHHPDRGLLHADAFMGVAEHSGFQIALERWMLEEVCRQFGRWTEAGVRLPRVAIEVSGAQLRQPDLSGIVKDLLQTNTIDPNLIEFELTERSLLEDPSGMRAAVYALKDTGVRLAIDYLGAGPSSISNLQQLPFDVLKIDKSFVAPVDANFEAQVLGGIIMTIANRLSLDTVAEGVESEKQEAFWFRHECQYGQGPRFGEAISAAEVADMMARRGIEPTRRKRPVLRRRRAVAAG